MYENYKTQCGFVTVVPVLVLSFFVPVQFNCVSNISCNHFLMINSLNITLDILTEIDNISVIQLLQLIVEEISLLCDRLRKLMHVMQFIHNFSHK